MNRKSFDELHPKKKKKLQPIVTRALIENKEGHVIQTCPECGHPTLKTGGCNFIKCVCGTQWCWICHLCKGVTPGYCSNKDHNSHS